MAKQFLGRTLLAVLCSNMLFSSVTAVVEVSLVVEPFDFPGIVPDGSEKEPELSRSIVYAPTEVAFTNSNGAATTELTLESEMALFGSGALHVSLAGQTTLSWVTLGSEPAFNAAGATHASFWYRSTSSLTGISLTFWDDSNCPSGNPVGCLVAYEYQLPLVDGIEGWTEARIELATAFPILRLDHVKGFSISIDASVATDVWLDHVAFIGDGGLFGAPFSYRNGDLNIRNAWPDATDRAVWKDVYHKSDLARNLSLEVLADDQLWLNYTIEDTEPWGGFAEYYHFIPGNGYYNLSQANEVTLKYNVVEPCTAPGEAHLRLTLYDSMHCPATCSNYDQKNVEVYYTFNYVLDEVGQGDFTIPLEGNDNSDSPFYLTGWAGSRHNAILDRERLKGFFIGISSDSRGGLGALLNGIVAVEDLAADYQDPVAESLNYGAVFERDLDFETGMLPFVVVPYRSPKACLRTCFEDPNCLYGFAGGFCFLSPSINASHIRVFQPTKTIGDASSFWMDDSTKRGDFCSLCECVKKDRLIDCKGKNLITVPKSFTVPRNDGEWTPRVLDLRENPQLALIGTGSLSSLSDTLEELFLPIKLSYLAPGAVANMTALKRIAYADELAGAVNVISGKENAFLDICCGLGDEVMGLSFCDMKPDYPGRDSLFLPFVEYVVDPIHPPIAFLSPDSPFAAEAAESAEKCADYCNVFSECRYFSYDQRVKRAQHMCYLMPNKGRDESYMCCHEDDYADAEKTVPGWISGLPPRTRNLDMNARVVISPMALKADKSNSYLVHFEVSLGAMPERGAVWIYPAIVSETEIEYKLTPEHAVLYDNTTTYQFSLQIFQPELVAGVGETLVIANEVKSCDAAFSAIKTDDVFVRVQFRENVADLAAAVIGVTLAAAAIVVGLVLFIVIDRRRIEMLVKQQDDDVERDELLEAERNSRPDNIRVQISRAVYVTMTVIAGSIMTVWSRNSYGNSNENGDTPLDSTDESGPDTAFVYSLGATFAVLFIAFLVYDWFVRIRNHKHVVNLAKSSEVISTMFPDEVRDRLLNETRANKKSNKAETDHIDDAGVIAELYPKTTICYMDIDGFDAWSSSRKPEQLFSFLEVVFSRFDQLARRCKVYKVETSGGCFVCVTGVPTDQEDHAQRMCAFASRCLRQFPKICRRLVETFGPDTNRLKLKIGIHSGQITLGVVRNGRPRYQLYGEAAGRAAHMMKTGTRKFFEEKMNSQLSHKPTTAGYVHFTKETADLLHDAGRGAWVIPCDDGKQEFASSFLLDEKASKKWYGSESSFGSSSDADNSEREGRYLVDWNTSQLLILLKKLMAHRNMVGPSSSVNTLTKTGDLPTKAFQIKPNQTFFDEVAEIIHLPASSGVDLDCIDYENITLPKEIEREVRSLVENIAEMYNDNPFHNFEHASHVTMSILKLLSRIVKPSARDRVGAATASLDDYSYGITADPLTHFAVAFCGMIHDADHPGVPNTWLVKEDPILGKRFSERSVAEQNSLQQAFELLTSDDYKTLRSVLFSSPEDQERFRLLVVNTVMATDIVDKDLKALRNNRWVDAFDETNRNEPVNDTVNRKATIILEHLIQASDVSHTMQHWNVYRKWNERLLQEMYLAYKQGRVDKDPTENWAKGEIGFFDFYIIPLAKKLKDCGVFGVSSDEYLNYALINRRKWEVEGEAITAEMVNRLKKEALVKPRNKPALDFNLQETAYEEEEIDEELV